MCRGCRSGRSSFGLRRRPVRPNWSTTDVGLRATFEPMVDPESHRWVDAEIAELVDPDELNLAGLGTGGQFPAQQVGREADGTLLADLAVVVRDDVPGVGIDTDNAGDLDIHPGFFLELAHDGLGDRLPRVHAAAGQRP